MCTVKTVNDFTGLKTENAFFLKISYFNHV